ncbi:PDR/VanB family oxidoreductase [Rhodococcus opacus]|uniref:PDR/VanB family oxidoreductase n=1 Tax=Rhodococcus opacus TaxID=37919 RepID=UPI000EAA62EF|nr:PDR/VanB family oxidoreductase [Rhodococcus opacus]QZS58820.1 PDR/VanB family oxidoreductase [Rhodococcus opacus]RKM74601.1 oxidoreductase [Rhodococcus opacus]
MTTALETVAGESITGGLTLTVREARLLCPGIRHVVLADPAGRTLPSFTPGSHIAVTWAEGRQNSYSLTGPSIEPDHYAISVRLDENGHGGSRWVHDLQPDQRIRVSLPRSAFAPVLNARHHLLVAGGIGVTPILSHVRAALEWGRSFEVIYSFRDQSGAHADELAALCGDRMITVSTPGELADQLIPKLADQPLGTHVYTCGPAPMIAAVAEWARDCGWPPGRVHSEAFGAGPLPEGAPFAATLGRTGMIVPVPSGTSLLEALLDKGINVPNLCRQGVCGECRLPVRGGEIEHRDLFLTEEEKASGESIMPCVSRSAGDRLELDL